MVHLRRLGRDPFYKLPLMRPFATHLEALENQIVNLVTMANLRKEQCGSAG